MRLAILLLVVVTSTPPASRATAALDWPAPAVAEVTETVTVDDAPGWVVESLLRVSTDRIEGAPVLRADLGNARFTHLGGQPLTDGRSQVGLWSTQPKWVAARADGALVNSGLLDAMARWGKVWDAYGIDRRTAVGRSMMVNHFNLALADAEARWWAIAGLWRPAPEVGASVTRTIEWLDVAGRVPVVSTVERLPDEGGHERLHARLDWTAAAVASALPLGVDAMMSFERLRPGHWLITERASPMRVEVRIDAWLDAATRRPMRVVVRRGLTAGTDGAPHRMVIAQRFDFVWHDRADFALWPSADDRPYVRHAEPPVHEGRRDPAYRVTRIPHYPLALHRSGVGGTVMLRARVGVDGRPLEVEVETSSGHPELDRAGQMTLHEWRFWPEVEDGAPVEAWVMVPLEFQLPTPPRP